MSRFFRTAQRNSGPFRKVVRTYETTTRYNRYGEGRRWFVLECGHEVAEKTSVPYAKRKRCRECA